MTSALTRSPGESQRAYLVREIGWLINQIDDATTATDPRQHVSILSAWTSRLHDLWDELQALDRPDPKACTGFVGREGFGNQRVCRCGLPYEDHPVRVDGVPVGGGVST